MTTLKDILDNTPNTSRDDLMVMLTTIAMMELGKTTKELTGHGKSCDCIICASGGTESIPKALVRITASRNAFSELVACMSTAIQTLKSEDVASLANGVVWIYVAGYMRGEYEVRLTARMN